MPSDEHDGYTGTSYSDIADVPRRPRSDRDLGFTRERCVRWFRPSVLVSTGLRAVLSSALGDVLDKRELQQAFGASVVDHGFDGQEVWIDYVSDTGDGFDATYSVAWLTAQRELQVSGLDQRLPRGRLLVLGGDEVYPSATPAEYDNRLKGPYKASLPYIERRESPTVVAIPGNHDWYDGLTNFMRVFCSDHEKWLGGRKTVQSRSYFAVRLTNDWWLWGIDIQFDSYIDDPQLQYFKEVAQTMGAGARLILCTARPSWADVEGDPEAFRNLSYLEARVIRPAGVRLLLSLSGDTHFLRLCIHADGRLTVYPIGLDVANRAWRFDVDNPDSSSPWLAPADGDGLRCHLIETPSSSIPANPWGRDGPIGLAERV